MVYNYTKSRGPIAAMYNSPGPCYGLPGLVGLQSHDPRSSHIKNPAYSFGVRHGRYRDDCSPGPCFNPDPKITRSGKDGTPHYSLYSRQTDGTTFKTPGPGSYRPESSGPSASFRHPAYSFGNRARYRKSDNSPAANSYTLPNMIGTTVLSGKRQAPCYTLSGRHNTGSFSEDMAQTPGPGTYHTTDPSIVKCKAPLYSMSSRNPMPGDTTRKPGPGAYSPEMVCVNKRKPPEFSFGIRHSPYLAPMIVNVPL